MANKIVVMLDGGHLRVHARRAGKRYDPGYIGKIGIACALATETIHRILYYDCAPFNGSSILPVSGQRKTFTGSDAWLKELSYKDLFSVRLGVLKFRGYVINSNKIPYTPGEPLTDADFHPEFEQKGVDIRIGIDMANVAQNRSVEMIALATNDTDCIPAMKHARRSGLQVALIAVPGYQPVPELLAHSDFRRNIVWPCSWLDESCGERVMRRAEAGRVHDRYLRQICLWINDRYQSEVKSTGTFQKGIALLHCF